MFLFLVVGRIQLTLPEGMSADNRKSVEFVERSNEFATPTHACGAQSSQPVNLRFTGFKSAKPENDKPILYGYLKTVSETLMRHENESLLMIVEKCIHTMQLYCEEPKTFQWQEGDYSSCKGYFQTVSFKNVNSVCT